MIGLVDCNNFFVSCERVFRPELIGKPVIVLSNNDGCAVALSNEAKALGFSRGNPYFQIRAEAERCGAYVFSGNHRLYGDMSKRVFDTLHSLIDKIEVYSIDEAFFVIDKFNDNMHDYGKYIARTIRRNTGIPVSVGIAPTKTLAKIASHFAKKHPGYGGACIIDSPEKIEKALALTDIASVWGIGRRNCKKLNDHGIFTALQFARMNEARVNSLFSVTGVRTWRELNGSPCISADDISANKKTITASRTFATDISDITVLLQAISTFSAIVCRKLREQNCFALEISVFLATNRFHDREPQYYNCASLQLANPTDDTSIITRSASAILSSIYRKEFKFKRAGITLTRIAPQNAVQQSLFADHNDLARRKKLMQVIDDINASPGNHDCVHLASAGNGMTDFTRREHASRLYTTRLSDIISIHCDK